MLLRASTPTDLLVHFPADRLESRTLDYVVYAGKDGLRVLRVPSSWRRLFARSFSSSAAYDATRAKFDWFEPPTAAAFEIPGFEATSPRSLFQLCIPGLLPALPPSLPAQGRFYRDPLVKALGNLG